MKKYLLLYEKLKSEIISGSIVYGQKIPSKRVTADTYNVSVITVEHAYDLLLSEGYIESKERSGYYVSFTKGDIYFSDSKNKTINNTDNVDKIYIADDTGISFAEYSRIVRNVLSEYGENIMQKSANSGVTELKFAIKNYLMRNRGIAVDESQIIIGSGAEYLYGLLVELFGKDLIYGIEKPSYRQIENVYRTKGVKYELLELSFDGISGDILKKTKARILHVTPYGSYPTGISASVSKKIEYTQWAADSNGFIIEDDYASEFSLIGGIAETIFSFDTDDRVIYINTFSKSLSRSLRVGYMLLPKRLVSVFNEKLGFYSCSVPTLEQYVIAEILNDGSFERHINRVRRKLRKSFNSEL